MSLHITLRRLSATVTLLAACGTAPEREHVGQSLQEINAGQAESGFPAVGCFAIPSVLASGGQSCVSGTLIAPSLVLTAKHVGPNGGDEASPHGVFITGTDAHGSDHVTHGIDSFLEYYPQDGSNLTAHDMLLVHLGGAGAPVRDIAPIQINTGPMPSVGTICTIVGWGSDGVGGYDRKKSAIVAVTSVGNTISVKPKTGVTRGGDSGGPLICGGHVVGVLSTSDGYNSFYQAVDPGWITQVANNPLQLSANYASEPLLSSVTGGPNVIDTFVRGQDGNIYHKWFNGNSWGPSPTYWEFRGGPFTGTPEAVSWGPNRLDIFARGGNDLHLYHSWNSNGVWGPDPNNPSSWEDLSGVLPYHPSAVSWGPARIDVFVVGTDGALWRTRYDGANGFGWGWQSFGTPSGVTFMGSVKAVSNGPNHLDVFAVGTDGALYHMAMGITYVQEGPNLVPVEVSGTWESLGGYCVGNPWAVARGSQQLDLIVKGGDARAYHKAYDARAPVGSDGTNWYPSQAGWDQLPNSPQFLASPVAASLSDGSLGVLGQEGSLAYGSVPPVPWELIAGITMGMPVLLHANVPFSSLQSLFIDSNFSVQFMTFNGSIWSSRGGLGGGVSW